MADFYTLITNMGLAKLANADLTGNKVLITHIAVGDGLNNAYYNPSQDQTALKHEVWRGAVNNKFIDSGNANKIIFETQIPVNIGGWYIREVGAFDADGHLIAVSKVAESYKPTNQQGAADEYLIRIPILYSNTTSVNIQIDPAVVLATRKYVDDEFTKHNSLTPHSGVLAPLAASMNFAKGQVISEVFNTVSIPENIMGLWFFDETGATSTIKDRSSKGHDLTLSKNASLLDPSYSGFAPYLNFNSDDRYFSAPDHADFTFLDGQPLTICMLVNMSDYAPLLMRMSVLNQSLPIEWGFYVNTTGYLRFVTGTSSNQSYNYRSSLSKVDDVLNKFCVLAVTFNGSRTANGINFYKNGVLDNGNVNDSGNFIGMENTSLELTNYQVDSAGVKYCPRNKTSVITLIKEELCLEQIKGLSQLLLGYANSL